MKHHHTEIETHVKIVQMGENIYRGTRADYIFIPPKEVWLGVKRPIVQNGEIPKDCESCKDRKECDPDHKCEAEPFCQIGYEVTKEKFFIDFRPGVAVTIEVLMEICGMIEILTNIRVEKVK